MRTPTLSPNELEVLRILWEGKGRKPAEIQEEFSWPIENATLRSTLVNLVEKGHVTRSLQGKAFFYSARVQKATLLQATMQTLARVFSGGSTQELVAQLVETGEIAPADLEIIRQAAAGRQPKTRKKSSS